MDLSSRIMDKRYTAMPAVLHEIRQNLRNILFELGLSPNQVDPLVLAVNEACTNIIEHGYTQENTGDILVEAFLVNDEISFRITDFARPTANDQYKTHQPKDGNPGGLGVHFMRQLMDSVDFTPTANNDGNIVIMKKTL